MPTASVSTFPTIGGYVVKKKDFDELRKKLAHTGFLTIIDVDSKGDQVAICRRTRGAIQMGPGVYGDHVTSFICKCHWSEVEAWYQGYMKGHRYSPQKITSDGEDTMEKLKEFNLLLIPNQEKPKQFYIAENYDNGRVCYEDIVQGDHPTFETLSQVDRWLEGRLYGLKERQSK